MDETNPNVLETVKLGRDYRLDGTTIHALTVVDIQIKAGEFVAIMGPSGSGKSTLLNLLGGLDSPSNGRILLDRVDLACLSEKELAALRRQKIGFVFQRHDLLPALTVAENLEFPLLLNGTAELDRQHRISEVLEIVGLSDKANNLPEELSGGQQQRVGIARALVNRPEIILADEPTGNLDSKTSAEIMTFLTNLCRSSGFTLIVVTHDPQVAALADRILRFKDGKQVTDQGGSL